MKTKSVPSLYRYCIVRLSTLLVSTFVPALNVLSTTLPDRTALSLVRTKAGPLPGFTCWNSTTDQSWLSMLRTMPFLRSLVDATLMSFSLRGDRSAQDAELSAGGGECDRAVVRHDQGVLDSDTPAAGEVHARLHGHRHSSGESTGRPRPQSRSLVDLQPDSVPRAVGERVAVPRGLDHRAGRDVDRH